LTYEPWLVGVGFFGGYLLILSWNALAAALSFIAAGRGTPEGAANPWNALAVASSYTGRTQQLRFPLGRCVLAAAGPSTLPVLLPIVLAWWGRAGDAASLVIVLTLPLSFWASGTIERRLPRSRNTASVAAVFSPPLPKRKAVDREATGSPLWDPDIDSPRTR
jgi:hypothetical protein